MARPTKKGLDYFPVDTHFNNKIIRIQCRFGIEGIGILITLWQHIYTNGYYCAWSDEDAETFAYMNHIDCKMLQDVVMMCTETGVFDYVMYTETHVLTSKGIQERFLEATKRRSDTVIDNRYRIIDDENGVNVNKNTNYCIHDADKTQTKSTQSKVKESKADKSKVKESKLKENKVEEHKLVNDFFNACWMLYPNKKGKGQISDKRKAEVYKFGEEFKRAIKRYCDEVKTTENQFVKHGSTFWNSGYIDYLDDNYSPQVKNIGQKALSGLERFVNG